MNDIKWKVEQINVDSGIDDCELSVEINGMFTNNGVFRKPITFDGLAKEIEHRLNDSVYGFDTYQPRIKDVIFNDPATIVFWMDGTKTVVKCQEGDEFDPEKGLTMAIAKKVYGNKSSYCNVIKKWTEPYHEKQKEKIFDLGEKAPSVLAAFAVAEDAIIAAKKCEEKKLPYFYNQDDPVFETRADAEKCVDILQELNKTYGCVTVADLYEASGLEDSTCYTMSKYGWINLENPKIMRARHGYFINLPRATLLDTEIDTKKKDPEFVKVTEHYGYAFLTNEDGDLEYYVMHKDELVNFTDTNAHDWTFHSKNRDYAVSMAHHLEYHHYISRGL